MKWRSARSIVLAAALALAPLRAGAADRFLSAIEDLPLMPGLVEAEEGGLLFDSPAGRIVEAYARGPVGRAAVLGFYAETLPQLGWRQRSETTFTREGEVLTLDFPETAELAARPSRLTVRFGLAPAASPRP